MKGLLFIIRYIRYWLTAKRRHSIHSPFVYDLIDKVLLDTKYNEHYQLLEDNRQELFHRRDQVETVDFGASAGNKPYRTQIEALGKMVRSRTHTKARLELLYRLAAYFKPKTILEFGTAAGVSASYLKKGAPSAVMITMEGCAGLAHIAEEQFQKLDLQAMEVVMGDFKVMLPKVLQQFAQLDLVFFDGNHRKQPTLDYFEKCLPLARENSVFIFDDIHWSRGMEEAWQEIQKHPQVSITIDLFWFGLVFFREGVAKQNFKIVY